MNEGEGMPEQEVKPRIDGQKGVATSKDNLLSGTSTTPPPSVNVEEGAIEALQDRLRSAIGDRSYGVEASPLFMAAAQMLGKLRRQCDALKAERNHCCEVEASFRATVTQERDDLGQACAELERRVQADYAASIIADLQSELATLRSSASAVGGMSVLCTFGPPSERKHHWILIFEDADLGDMHFDCEASALAAFRRYDDSWNCTLFVTAEIASRSPSPSGDGGN